jgi:phenylalanyl-tRNA synthetase beta chain
MLLSLAWIFDHIEGRYSTIDVDLLITKFNTHTAEIETFYKLTLDPSLFELVKCGRQEDSSFKFLLPDQKSVILPPRPETVADSFYLIKKNGTTFGWATLEDFGKKRDITQLPALSLPLADFISGSWKSLLPTNDVILDIDNKSLTNRPDMWGHRGFAREIAFLLDMKFKDTSQLLNQTSCHRESITGFTTNDFTLENHAPNACTAFSLTKFRKVINTATHPMLALRLAAIGQKSIDALVDLTNYVMYDWGHPMHAFDADKLSSTNLNVRFARPGESITLLDSSDICLTAEDVVVATDSAILSLAGIKGGATTAITLDTKSVLLEVANFKPDVIRRTSLRNKTRTDASARFEKNLDAEQIPNVIARFITLAKHYQIDVEVPTNSHFACAPYQHRVIEVEHKFLRNFSGLPLTPNQVIDTLSKLDFSVKTKSQNAGCDDTIYLVTVPSFRATKNIQHKEDILEEITRCIGFEKIPAIVPSVTRRPYDLAKVLQLRSFKRFLAYSAKMIEQANYPFYDETFLQQIKHQPTETLTLENPVSENQRRLVQSLIPGLLKNVQQNKNLADNLGFFEMAKIWPHQNNGFVEQKVVAGIFVSKRKENCFYEYKAFVEQMLKLCAKVCIWEKKASLFQTWEHNFQTATLLCNRNVIGTAGTLSPTTLLDLGFEISSTGFAFELLVDPLLDDNFTKSHYLPISKFPASYLDVSMFIPPTLTVLTIQDLLKKVHDLVETVLLLDIFEKKNENNRALTFRLLLQSYERSIEKTDLELVSLMATEALQKAGATVRS